ncbi:MAG: TonB-dependent receptor, partial [Campylobacterales bacterium]|nr:TonB-dependent receptor [Campylobacterales bacterium]
MQKKLQLSLLTVAFLSQLHAQEITLDTLTVTSATKAKQTLQEVTSNTEVITAEEIEERRFTTVLQALNSLSGISFSNNGGLGKATSLYVRGFDSSRVLVLIDGVRYNDITGLNGAPFEHLSLSDVEKIEVIKGAQSGIWGADASAGVINIITKSAQQGLHVSGRYNTKKFAANISYKNDDFYIKAASELLESDGFSAVIPENGDVESAEKDGYRNNTTNLKAGYSFTSTDQINITYTLINAQSDYDPTQYNPYPTIDYTQTANAYGEEKTRDEFRQITFKHIDSFNEFQLYAKGSKFDRDYINTSTKNYKGQVLEYGTNSKIPYRDNDFVLINLEYKNFKDTSESITNSNKEYSNKAGSITNSNIVNFNGEKFIFTEALRYDHYDKFDSKTSGKLGFKYNSKTLKTFSYSINGGTAYNVPRINQLYTSYGNPDLQPENTTSFDTTIEYVGFKATYFYNSIKDMIEWDSGYNNLSGKSILKGFEIGYNDYITDELLADISYTSLDAKNKDKKNLARRPKSTIKYALTYY